MYASSNLRCTRGCTTGHGWSAMSLQMSNDLAEIENMGRTMDLVQIRSLSLLLSQASEGSTDSGVNFEPAQARAVTVGAAPLAVFIPVSEHGTAPDTHHVSSVQTPTTITPASPQCRHNVSPWGYREREVRVSLHRNSGNSKIKMTRART